jgi:hypothetical protein
MPDGYAVGHGPLPGANPGGLMNLGSGVSMAPPSAPVQAGAPTGVLGQGIAGATQMLQGVLGGHIAAFDQFIGPATSAGANMLNGLMSSLQAGARVLFGPPPGSA